ncbi:PEBP-like protein [Testicularia cyperi]|uniref:PEBP-like protein n=1 Tax=Testicularia cyperi TaxID=1882483 RepID=A0A317XXS8_9BASI|nr:PEBP-like protein [Testicularia cyperi]
MSFAKSSLVAAAMLGLASMASADIGDASYAQVSTIQLNFPAADLTPVPIPAEWLDIQGVLNVTFGDVAVSNIGDMLTVAQVQSAPTFRISAQTDSADDRDTFDDDRLFTIAFFDAGVAGKNTSTEVFNHYLGNNFTIDDDGNLRNQTAARVAYGAPLPATDDGPHRYMQLVFQQFANFTPPATPAAGASISNLALQEYYRNANGGLGKIVAANYIQIEVGSAAAPSSTAPVSQASVTALAASKSAAQSSGTRSGSAAAGTSSGGSSSGTNAAFNANLASLPVVGFVAMSAAALLAVAML